VITVVGLTLVMVVSVRFGWLLLAGQRGGKSLAASAPTPPVQNLKSQKAFEAYLRGLAVAVAAGGRLADGVAQLSDYLDKTGFVPADVPTAILNAGDGRKSYFAALLIEQTGHLNWDDPQVARALLLRLRNEFEATYHEPMPEMAQGSFSPEARGSPPLLTGP